MYFDHIPLQLLVIFLTWVVRAELLGLHVCKVSTLLSVSSPASPESKLITFAILLLASSPLVAQLGYFQYFIVLAIQVNLNHYHLKRVVVEGRGRKVVGFSGRAL